MKKTKKAPHETRERPKRAFLVGLEEETLRELAGLADTLGLEIVRQELVRIREPRPKFGMGTGKAGELAEMARELNADCLIFDEELTPSQQRNWETLTEISCLDRQELIIQIFASRARTKEADLQSALAELSYSLPRLRHKYIDLSRQRGGRYGTKGSGETKLETDRRLVERRIAALEQEIAEVRRNREVQRGRRKRAGVPSCALVGYTNAGKSSLLNALTKSDALVEDKRFATLDTMTRKLDMGEGRRVLFIDTVGFIRRLPHTLVDAFRSTLEEVTYADMLIHVLDAGEPEIDRYFETTLSVLRELGADKIPTIIALNKIDRLTPEALADLRCRYAGSAPISAKDGLGLADLAGRVEAFFSSPAAPS